MTAVRLEDSATGDISTVRSLLRWHGTSQALSVTGFIVTALSPSCQLHTHRMVSPKLQKNDLGAKAMPSTQEVHAGSPSPQPSFPTRPPMCPCSGGQADRAIHLLTSPESDWDLYSVWSVSLLKLSFPPLSVSHTETPAAQIMGEGARTQPWGEHKETSL